MGEFKAIMTAMIRKLRTPPWSDRGNQGFVHLVRLAQFAAALATITAHYHW